MIDGKYKMEFGVHKDKRIENVPADYLLWLYDEMRQKLSDGQSEMLTPKQEPVYKYVEENYVHLVREADDYIPKFKPNYRQR